MKLSNRLSGLSESQTLQVAARCQELRAQGINVIGLSLGEPDFATPAHIKQAAIDAVNSDFSHYGPVPGFPALREAIAKTIPFAANEIIVSVGAKQAICNVILTLIDRGDEVIIPTPSWVSYSEMVKLAEGKPVFIPTALENDFKLTAQQLEQAITSRTKMLMICSPNNPTGSVYTREELQAIVDVLAKHPDIYVIADEIYEKILYTGHHESLAQFPEIHDRVILINGVSKAYAMTGYRIGFMACHDAEVVKAVKTLQGQEITCATTVAQKAAEAAYAGDQACVEQMRQVFEKRRDMMLGMLMAIPRIKCPKPNGAFYLFPDVSAYYGDKIKNSSDMVDYLLSEAHVACVAGSAFGEDKCIRLSYATSEDNIREALTRIQQALARL
ncbi:MAG: pyridoxal phosphate-dependent aminotransferase [Paludibacteraceae bacterium]|nr:pyridoxal phosphate-dependent aminotransferase [Paludibacteraceae bacterium]